MGIGGGGGAAPEKAKSSQPTGGFQGRGDSQVSSGAESPANRLTERFPICVSIKAWAWAWDWGWGCRF